MQRSIRRLVGPFALVGLASVIAGCSGGFGGFGGVNVIPSSTEKLRPDWLSYSGGKEEFTLRPTGPADLVGPEGQCAGTEPDPNAEPGALPTSTQGGISLQMTECEVVRRAGTPERVEFGANERGERAVVMTYSRGLRPGIYRFAGGRLISVERGPEPPPTRPKASPPPKRKQA